MCVASGFYPDHVSVSWQIDGLDVRNGVATDVSARREAKHYSISSRLRVSLSQWFTPGRKFTCTVNFFNGNKTVPYSAWVKGVKGPGAAAVRETYLRVTEAAKLTYIVLIISSSFYGLLVVFLVWKLQVRPT